MPLLLHSGAIYVRVFQDIHRKMKLQVVYFGTNVFKICSLFFSFLCLGLIFCLNLEIKIADKKAQREECSFPNDSNS